MHQARTTKENSTPRRTTKKRTVHQERTRKERRAHLERTKTTARQATTTRRTTHEARRTKVKTAEEPNTDILVSVSVTAESQGRIYSGFETVLVATSVNDMFFHLNGQVRAKVCLPENV